MTTQNQHQTSTSGQPTIGDFTTFTFPLVRRVFPRLVDIETGQEVAPKTPLQQFTEEVFAEEFPQEPKPAPRPVQPMTAPVGGIMFYKPIYGKKNRKRGGSEKSGA